MPGPLFPQQYNSMQAQAGLTPMGTPQLPPIMVPMGMSMPQAPHPGAVAGMLQQQAMMSQYVSPQPSQIFGSTTMAQPGMFGPSLPAPLYGNAQQARQRGVESVGRGLALVQGGVGVGARMAGYAAANMLLPGFGGMIYEGLGIGQGVQNMSNAMFSPIIQQRERALALQNQSTQYVVGGNMLSATGQGMYGIAAQQITSSIGRMADNPAFRRDTQNMFNRADVDRITRLSGELGMLDNAQTADQMVREIGRVSRAVSNFMKIAEEPDLQKAMQRMGQLRQMGMNVTEMPSAAANARAFARMAGVSIDTAMDTAAQQSNIYRQAGLSNASGFQASLGAQGMARQLSGLMDPRQLNMAGGLEGIQGTMMRGAASAATLSQMNMALIQRGPNGEINVDPRLMNQWSMGRFDARTMMNMAANNARRFGPGELLANQSRINDQVNAALGPQGQILAPMLNASMISRATGLPMDQALMASGMSEQDAATYSRMAQDPRFFSNMRQQMQVSMRERAVERRNAMAERNTVSARVGQAWHHTVGRRMDDFGGAMMDPIQRWMATTQDREEALALQGEGPARIIDANRLDSDVFRAGTRDLLGNRGREGQEFRRQMAEAGRRADRGVAMEAIRDDLASRSLATRMFFGPQGFGIDREMRGGDTRRSVVIQGQGIGTRAAEFVGFGPSAAEVDRMSREQVGAAQTFARGEAGTLDEQLQREAAVRTRQASQGMSREMSGRLQSAATVAMQEYVKSREGFLGIGPDSAFNETEMRAQMRQRMLRTGASARDVDAALADQEFRDAAARNTRSGLNESQQRVLDAGIEQSRNDINARRAAGTAQLREHAATSRQTFMEQLGLDEYGNASDADVRAVSDFLAGGGDSAEDQALREKVFTAVMMAGSSDADERERGLQEIERLKAENDPRKVEDFVTQARQRVNSMNESDREQMRERVLASGSTFEARVASTHSAAQSIRSAQADEAELAQRNILGDAGAAAYGESQDVSALRRNISDVKDVNIKRLLQSDASDEEIRAAITRAEQVAAGGGAGSATAEGAEATQEDREAVATGDAMISAIQASMEEFPTATARLSEASRALNQSAERLGEVADAIRIGAGHNGAN